MQVATLRETMVESWQPSKRCYIWVKAYIITTPNGIELSPPMRAISTRYEKSARRFCNENGWEVKIIK